jgi:parallel beta-helix repeat protein
VETIIVENEISGGSREGIYLIESGEVWIIRNKITTNQEGIVLTNSIPLIQDNQIIQNRGNGIMCIKYSKPKIVSN